MFTNKYKITNLQKDQAPAVGQLWETVKAADNFAAKHYQSVMQNPHRNNQSDFCVWDKNNLIAYMGAFLFTSNEAEIVAFVHPDYRRKGIFNSLLKETINRIKEYNYPIALFGINRQSKIAKDIINEIGAKFDHAEYRMERDLTPVEFNNKARIGFKEVGLSQLQFLTLIHSQSFPTARDVVEQRFVATMDEPGRITWMIMHQNKGIGKVHVRFEEDESAFIHDVCIVPKMQGRGIGKLAMQGTINKIIAANKAKILALEVEGDNERALNLYKGLGFEVVEGFDFYKLKVT